MTEMRSQARSPGEMGNAVGLKSVVRVLIYTVMVLQAKSQGNALAVSRL